MQLSIITAMDKNRVIGNKNKLPWVLPADLLHFKHITWGKTILMGRRTFESIGRSLPGRKNIVLSRQDFTGPGCTVYCDLEKAIQDNTAEKEIFIIGGENLYRQTLQRVNRLYLTTIHHEFNGDAFFPEWDPSEWEIIEEEDFRPDANNQYHYTFQTLKRR